MQTEGGDLAEKFEVTFLQGVLIVLLIFSCNAPPSVLALFAEQLLYFSDKVLALEQTLWSAVAHH